MHTVITGAGGFVGAALVQRLRAQSQVLGGGTALRLTLVDRMAPTGAHEPGVRWHVGSFADPDLLQALRSDPPACVFHLASVPGSLAEREPALGVQANLLDTVALLEGLAGPVREKAASAPRLVFASSVAVYGEVGPAAMTEDHFPQPTLSYGTHKWAIELLLADYSRRGELDACSLRLPGVVARPISESGHGSAFMSQIFHALSAGRPYVCPVSPQATAWWMSLERCLDNLLLGARLPSSAMPVSRCWQLPVLQASVDAVVKAIAQQTGGDITACLRYAPDARTEALFGRQPAVHASSAKAAGFVDDGSVQALVARVLASLPAINSAADARTA